MILAINIFSTVSGLFLLGTLLFRHRRIDTTYALFGICVCIACVGGLIESTTTNVVTAVWANKFHYLGSTFSTWLLVVMTAKLCNLKIHKAMRTFSLCFAAFVMLLVWTVEWSDLYYKSMELVRINGSSHLVKEYGPLHVLFPLLMVYFSIINVVYIGYAIKKRKEISTFSVVMISISVITVVSLYLVEKLTGTMVPYSTIGFGVSALLLADVFEHINTFDMSINISNTLKRMNNYGYIELDKQFRFISANEFVQNLFPEIKTDWRVDYLIPASDSFLYKEIVRGAIQQRENFDTTVHVGDLCFEIETNPIIYQKRKVGYIIELMDVTEQHKYTDTIRNFNERLLEQVNKKTEDLVETQHKLLVGMASMVESRDLSTGGHIRRTSDVVAIFAKRLFVDARIYRFSETFLNQVIEAAPMHDLGKIAVDDSILRKQGKFLPEEYEKMKKHSEEGAIIVEKILRGVKTDDFVDIAKNIAFYHHEKWNGEGYPKGLAGQDIPIEARIMALADVFDALVSKRCYKEAFSYDKAFQIIEESLGSHFDPDLGKCFLTCRPELEKYYNEHTE